MQRCSCLTQWNYTYGEILDGASESWKPNSFLKWSNLTVFLSPPPHHHFRATFTRYWRAFTSVTVVESSTGTWNPRTSWSIIRESLNWLILVWLGPLVFRSGCTHTRWESVHTTQRSSTRGQTTNWPLHWINVCVLVLGCYSLVPRARGPPGFTPIFNPCWCLEHWDYLCRTRHQEASVPRRLRDRPALQDLQVCAAVPGVN